MRIKPYQVEMNVVQIPRYFYELNKFVNLTEDVMFFNGMDFLNKLSINIVPFTAEIMPYHTAVQLI